MCNWVYSSHEDFTSVNEVALSFAPDTGSNRNFFEP